MATNDTMTGGVGNDTYYVDSIGDTIIEKYNAGIDLVNSSVTYTLANNIENLTLTGSASINGTGNLLANSITGNSGANVLTGAAGNDTLNGSTGMDSMLGGIGNDTYYVDNTGDKVIENLNEGVDLVYSSVTHTLASNVENLILSGSTTISATGNELNNYLTGNSAANTLSAGIGNDTLNGGAGNDNMIGGAGDDIYYVDATGDIVTEGLNEGTEIVYSSVSYTLGNNVEKLTLTGSSSVNATGNALDNVLTGNSGVNTLTGGVGNDTLDGAGGADKMVGGAGNDVYYVENTSDIVTENANEGLDVVNSNVSYTLGNNIETLILTGTAAINGTGSSSDNTIVGNIANNILTGGVGVDTMVGCLGNDTYYVDNSADSVVENANEGFDIVNSSVNYNLSDNVETLVLTGTAGISGGGNFSDNTITGNTGANVLSGGGGNDTLNGGSGVDTMIGGLGDDLFYVDNAADTINENSSEGIDTVNSTISYILGANVENLILSSSSTKGTGNASDNTITGNYLSNTLIGAAGNDTLIGGTGNDSMVGGTGNDSYYVDNSADIIVEYVNEGIDTINSTVTYTLTNYLENLALVGTVDANGIGNSYDNSIIGNSAKNNLTGGLGNDTLNGGVGRDTMIGGIGNDTYYVDNSGDSVTEGLNEGADKVNSSITYTLGNNLEDLSLLGTSAINGVGNALNNTITGNSAANTLSAGVGNDILDGGAGVDNLIGGLGNDLYYVDNTKDVVTEKSNEGFDAVNSSATYTISNNVESLTLTGVENINGTGNSLGNLITGNAGYNTLNGSSGADTMIGGLGNDSYYVDNIADVVTENENEGRDTVNSSINYSLGDNVENLILGGSASINATGNDLDNFITGNSAANILIGGAGNDSLSGILGADTMIGGVGDDSYYIDNVGDNVVENGNEGIDTVNSSITYILGSNVENITLTGTAIINGSGNLLDNVIVGNDVKNVLSGGAGNDTLNGAGGVDTLIGGIGNDSYYVDDLKEIITENVNEGTDTIYSSITYTVSNNVENLVLTGINNLNGTGNLLNNTITGNDGNNSINGGSGSDIMIGALGNDVYYVDNAGDSVVENANEGIDVVNASANFTLSANVENLTLIGSDSIQGIGNDLDNIITGNGGANLLSGAAGNDTLIGGLGRDSMLGGLGNDNYVVDITDSIIENENEGIDTINSSVTYTLGNNIENLVLGGLAAINGIGNELNNNIVGNGLINTLNGGAGIDTMAGGLGNDIYFVDNIADSVVESLNEGIDVVNSSANYILGENAENLVLTGSEAINGSGNNLGNVLTGNDGANVLSGGAGNDSLSGGAGVDTMLGGLDNDTYYIDNAEDVIVENQNEGTDVVNSSVTFTLSDNVEILTLTGNAAISGFGNDLSNLITGNAGINVLSGGAGNDNLSGGAGVDTMIGGVGDDTYYVENASDSVVENADEGIDTVNSSVNYTLSGNIESLILTGSLAINGVGNDLKNIVVGNTAANTIDGGIGEDTMVGGSGDDVYIVDSSSDVVVENLNEGVDIVNSSVNYVLGANVENLALTGVSDVNGSGNELDNFITGNAGANILFGGAGNDSLNGLVGADSMVGGVGNDVYFVDNAADFIMETDGEGTDVVNSSATYTLGNNLENLVLTGTEEISGSGNALDNTITGNNAVNVLFGDGGNDSLNGGLGADTMLGGTGDDTYYVENILDSVVENQSEGVDTVNSSISYSLTGGVENLTLTGSGIINGSGNDLDNLIIGNIGKNVLAGAEGNDTLNGGFGIDTMIGGVGNDTYYVDNVADVVTEVENEGFDTINTSMTYTLNNNVENLVLAGTLAINGSGNALNNSILGNGGKNILIGAEGNDTLNGAGGADKMFGGIGNDIYFVDDIGDSVVENVGEGNDSVNSWITYTLGNNIENLTLLGSGNSTGKGNDLDNIITGNSGINALDGSIGSDTMIGGLGNDVYSVDNSADKVIENFNEGVDIVNSSVTYTLGDNLESLILTGTAIINGTGNALDNAVIGNGAVNTLSGGAGNDILNGGVGADVMLGGVGDDNYYVDNIADIIIENSGEGNDSVSSLVSYTLAHNIERLTLTSTAATNATGNDLNNIITGNSAVNILTGGVGNDILDAGVGADKMIGGVGDDTYYVDNAKDITTENLNEGADTVYASTNWLLANNIENLVLTGSALSATGNSLDNTITGNGLANSINGGVGADVMLGGLGNDTYYVDNISDVVTENVGEGIDLVNSSVSYSLNSNIENLTLTGSVAINGLGNDLSNLIIGNTGKNVLTGAGGDDVLNGGVGIDTMIGGLGNDVYYVDSANDSVVENEGEGTDIVNSSATYVLGGNIENLTLTGTGVINGTGNELDNIIIGNSGKNTLNGAEGDDILNGSTGIDVMIGGLGNDTYYVDNASEVVTEYEDEGFDKINSSASYVLRNNIENLTLTGAGIINGTGNTLDNVLIGNAGKNTLTGLAGDDILDGGAGIDKMIGGIGNDTYYVDNVADIIVENINEGADTVNSSITYTLGANLENVLLIGSEDVNAGGNSLDNVIGSNSGNNILSGAEGNDTYVFNLGGKLDTIIDSSGSDIIAFGESIESNNIAFFQDNSGLYIDYGDAAGVDEIFISDWSVSDNQIEKIELSNGTFISNQDVAQIIQDLSVYATTHSIEFGNINDVKNNSEAMELCIANVWHS